MFWAQYTIFVAITAAAFICVWLMICAVIDKMAPPKVFLFFLGLFSIIVAIGAIFYFAGSFSKIF